MPPQETNKNEIKSDDLFFCLHIFPSLEFFLMPTRRVSSIFRCIILEWLNKIIPKATNLIFEKHLKEILFALKYI